MTPKELGELGHLEDAVPPSTSPIPAFGRRCALEPGLRKSVTHLREFAALEPGSRRKRERFDFFARTTGANRGEAGSSG
jgi:ferredoxin--NADP+ reductase